MNRHSTRYEETQYSSERSTLQYGNAFDADSVACYDSYVMSAHSVRCDWLIET